jgi:hypothetical protein
MKKTKMLLSLLLAVSLVLSTFCISAFASNIDAPTVNGYILSAEETAELIDSGLRSRISQTGTAYLPLGNNAGTNGNPAAAFVADSTNVSFAIITAPGATDYNVQLYAGVPGSGYKVSQYYSRVPINQGVALNNLVVGQNYYFMISSNSLTTNGCTATYTLSTF